MEKLKGLLIASQLLTVLIVNGQDLQFVTSASVPDSVTRKPYASLKQEFLNADKFHINSEDSLIFEIQAKSLLKRARLLENEYDFINCYIHLGEFRSDQNILDYTLNLSNLYQDKKLICLAHMAKGAVEIRAHKLDMASLNMIQAYKHSIDLEDQYYQWYIKYMIAVLDINLGNKRKGIQNLKEVESIFIDGRVKGIFKKNSHKANLEMLQDIRYAIALTYYETNDYARSLIYIEKVGEYAASRVESGYLDSYLGLKGGILVKQGQYKEGLEYTNAYLFNSQKNDADELSRSYVVQGLAYEGLGLKSQSIQSFRKTDSLHQLGGADYFYPELKTAYGRLYEHYKSIQEPELQIDYLNKIILYEERTAHLKNGIGERVEAGYKIPELIAEKEALIAGLKKNNSQSQKWTASASIIAVAGIFIAIFQYRKRKTMRKRFKALNTGLSEQKGGKTASLTTKNIKAPLAQLKAKHIEEIAQGLETFERKELFLKNDVTLKSLAKHLGTNSSYLSKYINAIKAENFSTYLSDLRIHYALNKLYESKMLRSFTIAAIANEVGFATTKSFSTHFKRITGMSVSYFLKNIETEKGLDAPKKEEASVVHLKDRPFKAG